MVLSEYPVSDCLQGICFFYKLMYDIDMTKNILKILSILLLLNGCSSIIIPPEFEYKEIKTDTFDLASWQKITNPNAEYKIYIEGDGYAYNKYGRPSNDPTPRGTLLRELAFDDKNANVVYLARPCQYIKSDICSQRHWTTARFAPEVINAEYQAVKQIAGDNDIILVGFSGGAQVAGLIASAKQGLKIKKIITIAGNLDHQAWVKYHDLSPLNESLNLADYYDIFINIPQIHYVGEKDEIIPPSLVKQFIKNNAPVIIVPNATHNNGWSIVFDEIKKTDTPQ